MLHELAEPCSEHTARDDTVLARLGSRLMDGSGEPDTRVPGRVTLTVVTGRGPHGEHPASADELVMRDEELERARASRFTIGVALHTTTGDWAGLQLAGIESVLREAGASLVQVLDCRFSAQRQAESLPGLLRRRPDAIISIPMGNALAVHSHRAVARAGVRLVLIDNAPTGLLPGRDYATVVSADSAGLGAAAAQLLEPHIPSGGTVLTVAYGLDFFVTNERELAFGRWMAEHRPDIQRVQIEFDDPGDAGRPMAAYIKAHAEMDGLFVVWDVPAMQVATAMRAMGVTSPMTTVDLSVASALEMARGGLIRGIVSQQPFAQGVAEARAALLSLLGREPPSWVALPGIVCTNDNLAAAFEAVFHAPPPPELMDAVGNP